MKPEEIPCIEVLSSVVFIVEDAFDEVPNAQSIQSHLIACPECAAEVAHERSMHNLLQQALRRTCDEKAPKNLYEDVHRKLREQMLRDQSGDGVTGVVTQFTMTEISIEIDEFGNVEHREIQIEQTHVQHFIDDDELN